MVAAPAVTAVAASAGATVECPSDADYLADERRFVGSIGHGGLFVFAGRVIVLSPTVCGQLESLAAGEALSDELVLTARGYAVYVLAHELGHAAGLVDEAAADCRAAGTFLGVARAVGVRARDAVRLLVASARVDGYDPAVFIGCAPSLMPNAV